MLFESFLSTTATRIEKKSLIANYFTVTLPPKEKSLLKAYI